MIEVLIGFVIGLLCGIYQQEIRDWVNDHILIPIHRWQRIPWSNDVSFAGGNLTGFDYPREGRIWPEETLDYIDKVIQ